MNVSPKTLLQTTHPVLLFCLLAASAALSSKIAAEEKPQSSPQVTVPPAGTPVSWVNAAIANEMLIINDNGATPLRYRVHKIDAKGDTVRIEIESRQGAVARLIERDGKALTAADDAAERARLQAILDSPDDFLRHHKHDSSMRSDVIQLVRLIPQAMVLSYAPDQPQRSDLPPNQIVIDFHPNPAFRPPGIISISEALTGIEGRMWIDATSHRLTRIQGHFLKPVNFGYGIVARIYPGGTIEFEQTNAGGGRWVYSNLVEHLTVRAMMVKTIPEDSQMTASDFHLLPAPVDFQQAVRQLLAMPIPTR